VSDWTKWYGAKQSCEVIEVIDVRMFIICELRAIAPVENS
jgi:hypothetical protein